MKTKIAIIGANGKMGSKVTKELENDYDIIKIDKNSNINLANESKLVIDFSTGTNSVNTAYFCYKNKIPLIIGATGQTKNELMEIKNTSTAIPIMICSNFSCGINFMKKALLDIVDDEVENIVVFEKHHIQKKDKPSGTALELRDFLKKITDKKIDIISQRGGKEIGLHQVDIYFEDEVLSISHQAYTREAFARGVYKAAKFMVNQTEPGIFSFEKLF